MTSLRADRRLYESRDKDVICEEGDVRSSWLLAGVGSTIGAGDVAKYGLTFEGGRVRYAGAPDLPDLPVLKEASKPEDKAATEHEDKSIKFGGEGAQDEEAEIERIASEDEADGGADFAEASDDSDRNTEDEPEDDELEEWTRKSSPEAYLEKYPTGPAADLARSIIAAQETGADGAT